MPILVLDENGEIQLDATRSRLAAMEDSSARDSELRLDGFSCAIEIIRDLMKSTPENDPLRLQFADLYGRSLGLFALQLESSEPESLYLGSRDVGVQLAGFVYSLSSIFPDEMGKISQMLHQIESLLTERSKSDFRELSVSALTGRLGL